MNDKDVILIADDDAGHVTLIKKNLKSYGIKNKVLTFPDGKHIQNYLTNIKSGSYVLLLDINMPKLNGIEVLEYMKQTPTLSSMPVIMFTTSDDTPSRNRCLSLGCVEYIVKHIDYEKFTAAIKRMSNILLELEIPHLSN